MHKLQSKHSHSHNTKLQTRTRRPVATAFRLGVKICERSKQKFFAAPRPIEFWGNARHHKLNNCCLSVSKHGSVNFNYNYNCALVRQNSRIHVQYADRQTSGYIALALATLCLKKVPTFKLSVTLSSLNGFSTFIHCWQGHEICYKPGWQYPTNTTETTHGIPRYQFRLNWFTLFMPRKKTRKCHDISTAPFQWLSTRYLFGVISVAVPCNYVTASQEPHLHVNWRIIKFARSDCYILQLGLVPVVRICGWSGTIGSWIGKEGI